MCAIQYSVGELSIIREFKSLYVTLLFLLPFLAPQAGVGSEDPAPSLTKKATDEVQSVLLPNGWRLSPAGEQIPLNDLPLNILPTPDGKYVFVATSGYNAHELTAIDLATSSKVGKVAVRQSWFGLAADFQQGKIWWSGGGNSKLHTFHWADGKFQSSQSVDTPQDPVPKDKPASLDFRTGLYWDGDSETLYSLSIVPFGQTKTITWDDGSTEIKANGYVVRAPRRVSGKEVIAPCGKRPYDVVKARNGLLYVSDWADRCVLILDAESLRTIGKIPVGEHPNQLALHPTDDRLFVACASSNGVWVIDTRHGTSTETIYTSLFPKSPEGSTPDALCVAPDGETLYVANADNNCVAVIDIETPRHSQVKGFIPTGWYPTAISVTPDGKKLLVGVGKGNETKPNKPDQDKLDAARTKPPQAGGYRRLQFAHVGTTLSGALSVVTIPDEEELKRYTDQVYRNCPYSDDLLTASPYERKTAIPTKVGDPSPIKHVIYVIKENRTYDQVLSDIPRGNRDPSLLMFGEEVTPNHHKLANDFVLLDNLYCNGHVSKDGHPWSTMAYNTDYIARNWALTYSDRQGIDDDDDGDLSNAPSGYIWDACKRNGVSYRSYAAYGSRASQPDGTFRMEPRVPGLVGHISPKFGAVSRSGKKPRDPERIEAFIEEFRKYERKGDLPRFIIMNLGEDHTEGTRPGGPTPAACVASNDVALGTLVDVVSHSQYWPQTAIFVIEDDAQNGPDHVDAHRTVGFVISPFVRRKHLDSSQYSTVSMLRTMELILGLPPLSQFDAAATPMFESFTDKPDLTPYKCAVPRIDLDAVNTELAYGAERSRKMDFSEYDRIDDFELNEILWRSIKGPEAPLPPAVRRAIAFRGVDLPERKENND